VVLSHNLQWVRVARAVTGVALVLARGITDPHSKHGKMVRESSLLSQL